MALSAPVLSAMMRTNLRTNPAIQTIDGAALTGLCDALAQAIVTHIQGAATVSVVGTATGVTAGAAAVPCTAVGSIT